MGNTDHVKMFKCFRYIFAVIAALSCFFHKAGFSDDFKYMHDIPSMRNPYKRGCNDMYF